MADASERLGVSAHRLYKCVKAAKRDNSEQQAKEMADANGEVLKLAKRHY